MRVLTRVPPSHPSIVCTPLYPVAVAARIRIPDDSEFSSGLVDLIRRCLMASSIYRPSASEARCGPPFTFLPSTSLVSFCYSSSGVWSFGRACASFGALVYFWPWDADTFLFFWGAGSLLVLVDLSVYRFHVSAASPHVLEGRLGSPGDGPADRV